MKTSEIIKGYKNLIKQHQKYIDEFQARIDKLKDKPQPLFTDDTHK